MRDSWQSRRLQQKIVFPAALFHSGILTLKANKTDHNSVAMKLRWKGTSPLLFQVKSGKELKAFLFNDFLMLTRPRSSIAGSLSKKIGFESNEQDAIYDIYRKVGINTLISSISLSFSSLYCNCVDCHGLSGIFLRVTYSYHFVSAYHAEWSHRQENSRSES